MRKPIIVIAALIAFSLCGCDMKEEVAPAEQAATNNASPASAIPSDNAPASAGATADTPVAGAEPPPSQEEEDMDLAPDEEAADTPAD